MFVLFWCSHCLHERIELALTSLVTQLVKNLPKKKKKESAYRAGDPHVESWFGKIPWSRARLPTPVFLPGEFHEQRSLVGFSPLRALGLQRADTTEHST